MNFLYMSFSAGCIVLFTVLLRTLFKKKLPIELFCGLWWLAMLRALIPFSIPSVYSVYNAKIGIGGWFEKSLDLHFRRESLQNGRKLLFLLYV